jgi:hypothetical protein
MFDGLRWKGDKVPNRTDHVNTNDPLQSGFPKGQNANLKPTAMKKVFCNLFGHHFSISKKVTQHIKEYKCIHCGKHVTTDVNGNLSTLTPELKDINATLEDIYQKRHRAAQQVA